MRILHFISQRPDSTGSGSYLQAMLREAAAYQHDNFLVAGIQADRSVELDCVDPGNCIFVRFGEDISYQIVGMSDVMPYQSARFSDLSQDDLDEYERVFARALTAAVTRFQPHVIHAHHLWIGTCLARRLFPQIPVVATCHGSDLRQFQNCPHLHSRVLSGCRQLDAVMALSKAQMQEIVRLYELAPPRVVVVGAGYNAAAFTSGPKPAPRPVQLVYAGKLSKAKGVPWLLRALSRISSPAWRLHLIGGGSGPETDSCLSLAKQLGRRVIVHGALPVKDLAAIMRQSHVLVLPSFFEGLGLVVLEGLASGCRIVATDLPGVREVLGDDQLGSVSLVKAPRLRFQDQPFREDEQIFEHNLARALQIQINAAYQLHDIEVVRIREKILAFSWSQIFDKVQQVYIAARTHGTDGTQSGIGGERGTPQAKSESQFVTQGDGA